MTEKMIIFFWWEVTDNSEAGLSSMLDEDFGNDNSGAYFHEGILYTSVIIMVKLQGSLFKDVQST